LSLNDPMNPGEQNIATRILVRRARGLLSGERVPNDWSDSFVCEEIARALYGARVDALVETMPLRLQHVPRASSPADSRTDSSSWHGRPSDVGPEFDAFVHNVVRPFFEAHHPLADQKALGSRIIALRQANKVGYRDDIIGPQMADVARYGYVTARVRGGSERLTVPLAVLRLIIALAEPTQPHSRHPRFWIVSFVRLRGNPRSDHYRGYAIDVTKYDGKAINMRRPEDAFLAVTALIQNLPRGRYQLGLPRPPTQGEAPGGPESEYDHTARFSRDGNQGSREDRTLDAEQFRYFYDENGEFREDYASDNPIFPWRLANPFLDRRLREGHAPGSIGRDLEMFENPQYRRRFETAMAVAARNGAIVADLFPDKPNHLHISILE